MKETDRDIGTDRQRHTESETERDRGGRGRKRSGEAAEEEGAVFLLITCGTVYV